MYIEQITHLDFVLKFFNQSNQVVAMEIFLKLSSNEIYSYSVITNYVNRYIDMYVIQKLSASI